LARVETTWRAFERRFGLRITNPIREIVEGVFPVVQAATPDFTDTERPYYWGGAQTSSVGTGQLAAVSLRVLVPTALYLAQPLGGAAVTVRLWLQAFDAVNVFAGASTDTAAAVAPFRPATNVVRFGRSGNAPAVPTMNFFAAPLVPLVMRDVLLLDPGFELVFQSTQINQVFDASFQWRELGIL
jgi:hypothetical protein